MENTDKKPTDDEFINFMMKVMDFKDASIVSLKQLHHGAEVYIIRSVELGGGYTGYRLDKAKFIEYHHDLDAIELEDIKGNYIGHVPLSAEGHPVFTINKFTGEPDPLERIFISYYEAMKYMHQIKYICDVNEEHYLLGLFQGIKGYKKKYDQ